MENESFILISEINDFTFCPASIYFHHLFSAIEKGVYCETAQLNGLAAHKSVDEGTYSSLKDILLGIDVMSEEYGVTGKIDIFNCTTKTLIERKTHISKIHDGQIFQVYAQYFALKEMGYSINCIQIHSIDDNITYPIILPENNPELLSKFKETLRQMRTFSLEQFNQLNEEKCTHCIYNSACTVTAIGDDYA